MGLKIYNSQSKQLEEFASLTPKKVKMYVCGPTVYNFLHVGNFRGPVVFNMVRNWLEYLGYEVDYALNFTDVDDKIINKANEEGVKPEELSERYIAEYKKDFADLGLKAHSRNPKVTEHMQDILQMIQSLIEQKKAYVAGGDVMYSIATFKDYGKLSGRNTEDLLAGARVEVNENKANPLDFALWKGVKPGEPSWAAPWGSGRPGWHIECSAMIKNIFGDSIDIHGGGMDLIFPHHENEIAQSEGCTGKTFVKYWMHNNMLNFSGQKMSKSLGNIVTMREFLKDYHAEIYKWMILSSHYRSVAEFGEEAVHRAVSGLARVYSAMAVAESLVAQADEATKSNQNWTQLDPKFAQLKDTAWATIESSLNDDFGTPNAFAALFELVRAFNAQVKRGAKVSPQVLAKAQLFLGLVKQFGAVVALFQEPAQDFLTALDNILLQKLNLNRQDIEALVQQRVAARDQKDFKRSDELRNQLLTMGISVMDTPQGSVWEVSK